jgi:uracil phosphoribosyltransferase
VRSARALVGASVHFVQFRAGPLVRGCREANVITECAGFRSQRPTEDALGCAALCQCPQTVRRSVPFSPAPDHFIIRHTHCFDLSHMRRSADRATRLPSSRDLDGSARADSVDPPTEYRKNNDNDDSETTHKVGPTAAWPRRSAVAASGSFSAPWERPSPATAPRHRMAWMLAHAPEFSHLDKPIGRDAADRTDLMRLRLDSPLDESRSRATEMSRHENAESEWDHTRYHVRTSQYASASARDESFSTARHFKYGASTELPVPRYFIQKDVHSPHELLIPEISNDWKQETHDRLWTTGDGHLSNSRFPEMEIDGHANGYEGSDVESVDAVAGEEDLEETKALEPSVPKKSRYLREMDRRVILERLAQGEKQAPLAKEFNVSRAAISNLFKHRREILARSDENPFAKHPKTKKKLRTKQRQQQERVRALSESHATEPISSDLAGSVGDVHEAVPASDHPLQAERTIEDPSVMSRAVLMARSRALPLLLSKMSDSTRSLEDFRHTTERILWLLLEEALAAVPVETPSSQFDQADALNSFATRFPPCAVSMEKNLFAVSPLLSIFQLMEPHQPSGIATVSTAPTERSSLTVEIADTDLPKSLRGYNVFLLNIVAASGEAVCATIERLLSQFDVAEGCVTVVALFVSSEVVAMVQCKYPMATIVTARIDSTITRRNNASTSVDIILQRMFAAYGRR